MYIFVYIYGWRVLFLYLCIRVCYLLRERYYCLTIVPLCLNNTLWQYPFTFLHRPNKMWLFYESFHILGIRTPKCICCRWVLNHEYICHIGLIMFQLLWYWPYTHKFWVHDGTKGKFWVILATRDQQPWQWPETGKCFMKPWQKLVTGVCFMITWQRIATRACFLMPWQLLSTKACFVTPWQWHRTYENPRSPVQCLTTTATK